MNAPIERNQPDGQSRKPIWWRGLYMFFFIIALSFARILLNLIAIVQFLSMVIFLETNRRIALFGASLGQWLEQVAAFQSGNSEDKPFPWNDWPHV